MVPRMHESTQNISSSSGTHTLGHGAWWWLFYSSWQRCKDYVLSSLHKYKYCYKKKLQLKQVKSSTFSSINDYVIIRPLQYVRSRGDVSALVLHLHQFSPLIHIWNVIIFSSGTLLDPLILTLPPRGSFCCLHLVCCDRWTDGGPDALGLLAADDLLICALRWTWSRSYFHPVFPTQREGALFHGIFLKVLPFFLPSKGIGRFSSLWLRDSCIF